jgi:hypothetical protein
MGAVWTRIIMCKKDFNGQVPKTLKWGGQIKQKSPGTQAGMSRSLKATDSDHSKAVPEDEKLNRVVSALMVVDLVRKNPNPGKSNKSEGTGTQMKKNPNLANRRAESAPKVQRTSLMMRQTGQESKAISKHT